MKTPLLLLIFRGKYDTIFLRKTQEKKKDEGKERGRKGADENVWKRRSKGKRSCSIMRVHRNPIFPVAMRLGDTPVPIPNTMVKT